MWVGGRVTALAAWASGPSALASQEPWGRRCRGTHNPTRSRERSWGRRSVHGSVKLASRRRFGAFVYTVATLVATRAASGGTSVPTTMTCRRHSPGGRLPLGRENRLCASGATARLASSPRQQPTQTPEELQKAMGTLSLRATTRHPDYLDAKKSKVSSMLTTRRQAIPGLKACKRPPAHETIVSGKGA